MNYHEVGVRAWRRGEGSRWVVALAASKLIGKRGAVSALAQDMAVTPQQVRRLAGAYQMYDQLRYIWEWSVAAKDYPHPRHTRKQLNTEHYTELGEALRRYDLSPVDLFSVLHTAAEEGFTAKDMRESLDGEHRAGLPPVWWTRLEQIVDLLGKLRGDYGLPDYLDRAANAYYKAGKKYLERGYPIDSPPQDD